MKRLKWPAVLLAIVLSACQLPMELPPTATAASEQALVTGTPSPISTVVGATRPVQTTPRSPAAPVATAERDETATPTPALVEMGRLYFTGFEWYGWYDLVAQEKGQELIIDSADFYNRHSSLELIRGPGTHKHFEFSHYSNQSVYTTLSELPGELWLSDVTYRKPQKLFTDSEGRFEGDFMGTWSNLNLAWSPDDKHIFLYHGEQPELSLIYHLETGEFEPWYWTCHSVMLSARSGRLTPLCPRVAGAPPEQSAYAIIEWDGEIWYTDSLPGEPFLEPTADSHSLWQWSANGDFLAYYDPRDPAGHLMIADSQGNIRQLLPGISVLSEVGMADFEYTVDNRDQHFNWSRNSTVLLVKGYGQPEYPCPPFVSEYDPDIYVPLWPCWQAVDVESGEVIWSEGGLGEGLFLNEEVDEPYHPSISIITISPDGRFIALFGFRPHRYVAVVDLWSSQATTISQDDNFNQLYWTTKPED